MNLTQLSSLPVASIKSDILSTIKMNIWINYMLEMWLEVMKLPSLKEVYSFTRLIQNVKDIL